MSHECEQREAILKIFNVLDEIKDNVAKAAIEQALTNHLLKGNGTKGICERVADLEKVVNSLSMLRAQFLAIGSFVGFIVSMVISLVK